MQITINLDGPSEFTSVAGGLHDDLKTGKEWLVKLEPRLVKLEDRLKRYKQVNKPAAVIQKVQTEISEVSARIKAIKKDIRKLTTALKPHSPRNKAEEEQWRAAETRQRAVVPKTAAQRLQIQKDTLKRVELKLEKSRQKVIDTKLSIKAYTELARVRKSLGEARMPSEMAEKLKAKYQNAPGFKTTLSKDAALVKLKVLSEELESAKEYVTLYRGDIRGYQSEINKLQKSK